MPREGGVIGWLQEAVEQRTGKTVIDQDRLSLLEASDVERRNMQREMDLLGYYVLDQIGGQPQEVKATERRKMAAQARMVWIQDPVAGANVDLSCQFIFGRGVPKPKAVDAKVQEVIDEAWCHDDATEALTDEGWFGLSELRARWESGTLPAVAAWRDGGLVYETPEAMNVSQYSGPMKRFSTQQLDMLVTPNHRMIVRAFSGREQVKRADAIQSKAWRVPASAALANGTKVEEFVLPGVLTRERRRSLVGVTPNRPYEKAQRAPVGIPMDAWCNWLGWWLAEGHASLTGSGRRSWSVYVCQATDGPLLGKLKSACGALGIEGRERTMQTRWGGKWIWSPRNAKQIGTWLVENCLRDGEKRIPEFVFSLAVSQQALVLDGLLAGDGNYERIMSCGNGAFYTSSPALADDVQRLAVNCGWKATLRSRQRHRTGPLKREYIIQLNRRREHWLPVPTDETYDGKVWCFKMPSGTMVTRRNGKVAISGNSDEDNKAALTSFPAQVALCTDLVLQSNLFILFFEDGDDGKVKLGILNHDLVEDAVRDSQNRLRVLYYVARRRDYEWDYSMDRVSLRSMAGMQEPGRPKVLYYQALAATNPETGELDTDDPTCPPEKLGDGLVYHIAINRGSEQVFGIPAMRRIVKWMAALNDFMAARVDMTQAAAAFIMRRTVKGSPSQVAKIAAKALSRTSSLAATSIDDPNAGVITPGPRPASVLNESEGVTTEPFSVSTQSAQAVQDAQMIRSQIASATWPQHYLGDQCHDAETETLTDEGWMGYERLRERALAGTLPRVVAYDIEHETLRYEQPTRFTETEYDGELVRFHGRAQDVLVTPSHRMVVARPGPVSAERTQVLEAREVESGRWAVRAAADLDGGCEQETFVLPAYRKRYAPNAGSFIRQTDLHDRIRKRRVNGETWAAIREAEGCSLATISRALGLTSDRKSEPVISPAQELDMDRWLDWLGWVIAEGSIHEHRVSVSQSLASPFLARLQAACVASGLKGRHHQRKGKGATGPSWHHTVYDVQVANWCAEHVGSRAERKRIPEFVWGLTRRQKMILLRSLMYGDGRCDTEGRWEHRGQSVYGTSSRQLADDVQRLALECGFRALLSRWPTRTGRRQVWRVGLVARGGYNGRGERDNRSISLGKPSRVRYRGPVYCLTLPSGTMVTRRNGRVAFHGNSNANLATASALELPVVKKVEAFQELFEELFRTFTDRVIQKAVDSGRLPTELTEEERAALKSKKPGEQVPGGEGITPPSPVQQEPPLSMTEPAASAIAGFEEAYHGQTADEKLTERDLGYEFSMPNPLKRAMTDLITSIANLARTFDPNNTNLELSRTLLSVALGQGLELADPAAAVERILPEGYVDPMIAASMGAGGGGPGPGQPGQPPPLIPQGPNPFGPEGPAPGEGPEGEQNPYGAQGFSSNYQANQGQISEGLSAERLEKIFALWDEEIGEMVDEMLAAASSNGNGNHA